MISTPAEAIEAAAKYHDNIADKAMASYRRAEKQGVEFSNRGQDVAIAHRRHATAIRALSARIAPAELPAEVERLCERCISAEFKEESAVARARAALASADGEAK